MKLQFVRPTQNRLLLNIAYVVFSLFSIFTDQNEIHPIPEYVSMICKKNIECEDSITEFKFDMEKNGYEEMARDKHAIIFKLIN